MYHEEALRKAMGCLRLAQRAGTPEEAATAAAKAQKIIDDYKLDITGIDYDAQEKERETEEIKHFGNDYLDVPKGSYMSKWSAMLASSIAKQNQCRLVLGAADSRGARPISIIGRPSDVSAVRYLHGYFKSEVIRLADENTKGNSDSYRGHFCIGVVDIISNHFRMKQAETFAAKKTEVANNQLALVRVNNAIARIEKRYAEVGDFVNNFYRGALRKGRGFAAKSDNGGRAHGQREGRNVRFTSSRGSLGAGAKQIEN